MLNAERLTPARVLRKAPSPIGFANFSQDNLYSHLAFRPERLAFLNCCSPGQFHLGGHLEFRRLALSLLR
jgi:hypothetical protein